MDRDGVVAFIHRRRRNREPSCERRVQEYKREAGFVVACRLDLPGDGKLGFRTDRRLNLVPVKAAALPRRDGAAVPPRCVGVGEPLPLRPVLRDEPLTVRVGRKIARVDSEVAPVLGQLRADSDYTVSLLDADDIRITINDDGKLLYSPNAKNHWKPKTA